MSDVGACPSTATDATRYRRVLVVSKTHLDVGFTDLAGVVRRRYLDDFFPRAIRVAAELRSRGGPERFRWTTGSWILTEALEAEAREGGHAIEDAVTAGDLCWHALPFTTHTEYCERSLFEHGLSLSAELDDRFGHRTRAAKMTDVPGHTRALVSVLADAGFEFLHIGVNPASAVPDVPPLFRWRDLAAAASASETAAPEIVVMYQRGGYGAPQVLPGGEVATAIDVTGDNLGPRGADDVIEHWAMLRRRFPGAELVAASLDDVADEAIAASAGLPVVTAEIGDTWIQGTGTDPQKTSAFRALCRSRASWIRDGRVDAADPVLRRASTELLLVAEHTWGLDQKTHWPDEENWSAEDLASVRDDPSTVRFESSWAEQRDHLDNFISTLRRGGLSALATAAESARESTESTEPFIDDLQLLVPAGGIITEQVGGFRFVLGRDGGVTSLVTPDGYELVSPSVPLAAWTMQTFDAADIESRFATYNATTTPQDMWWARWDNTKPGLERSRAESLTWTPMLRRAWAGPRGQLTVLVAELTMDVDRDVDPVAAPTRAYLTVRAEHIVDPSAPLDASGSSTTVTFDLSTFGTPAARWPTASWWSFGPKVSGPAGWRMAKLGEWVDPLDVIDDGGRFLHCADRLAHSDGLELELVDTSLVAPGRPRLLAWDGTQPDLSGGWHLCLYDNVWGTNFPMWTEGDDRFRIVLRVPRGV
ncbi:hypothetical protein BH10ACT3_BH10ACT3_20020 [soil metagenome]